MTYCLDLLGGKEVGNVGKEGKDVERTKESIRSIFPPLSTQLISPVSHTCRAIEAHLKWISIPSNDRNILPLLLPTLPSRLLPFHWFPEYLRDRFCSDA